MDTYIDGLCYTLSRGDTHDGIDTIECAEELVHIFSRICIPQEIFSDRGSQFVSDLMREISRLLSVRQLQTTPYHAQCNGLVERWNGTLRRMLQKMAAETPSDLDRYIPALLFSYTEKLHKQAWDFRLSS